MLQTYHVTPMFWYQTVQKAFPLRKVSRPAHKHIYVGVSGYQIIRDICTFIMWSKTNGPEAYITKKIRAVIRMIETPHFLPSNYL